jgi:hypothetical protein
VCVCVWKGCTMHMKCKEHIATNRTTFLNLEVNIFLDVRAFFQHLRIFMNWSESRQPAGESRWGGGGGGGVL